MYEAAQGGTGYRGRGVKQQQWSGSKIAGDGGPSETRRLLGVQMNPYQIGVAWSELGSTRNPEAGRQIGRLVQYSWVA